MRHASLFSGIGGFDLAAEWVGWENVFNCEIDPWCRRVLKKHFPKAVQHEDITKTCFKKYNGKIDVITGGFPCQPFSAAGKQKGTEDNRHLWPEMFRVIKEIKPTFIVGENVGGFVSWNGGLVLEKAFNDLESENYEVGAFVLPACDVNAEHQRQRVWIIAYTKCERLQGLCKKFNVRKHKGQVRTYKPFESAALKAYDLSKPRFLRTYNGVPRGVDRIRGLGNAVVPQLVYEILKKLDETRMAI